jgi:hypothetical protein
MVKKKVKKIEVAEILTVPEVEVSNSVTLVEPVAKEIKNGYGLEADGSLVICMSGECYTLPSAVVQEIGKIIHKSLRVGQWYAL